MNRLVSERGFHREVEFGIRGAGLEGNMPMLRRWRLFHAVEVSIEDQCGMGGGNGYDLHRQRGMLTSGPLILYQRSPRPTSWYRGYLLQGLLLRL